MKRRRILLLLVLAAATAAGFLCWPRGPREPAPPEPVYQGRTLSEWLEDAYPGPFGAKYRTAEQAVQAIGTNALPWLMSEFKRRSDANWFAETNCFATTRSWLAKQSWTNGRLN